MEKAILLILFTGTTGVICAQQQSVATDAFQKISWLEGQWHRQDTTTGKRWIERWWFTSPVTLNGIGVTVYNADTIFVEGLRIVWHDGTLHYIADVAHNQQPVKFRFTEWSATGFTCENPAHDFPKKIVYRLEGDLLKATISAGSKHVDFLFVRQ